MAGNLNFQYKLDNIPRHNKVSFLQRRQRQEITKRMRERRQRKMDEEERRKMENERMFHEWLLKKRQQAKEQWMRNQRLRAMRYSRQCITPNQ